MPGLPIKLPELPVSADPQNESVFDPLHKTLMRRAVSAVEPITDFLGGDDPSSQLMGIVGPLGTASRAITDVAHPAVKRLLSFLQRAKIKDKTPVGHMMDTRVTTRIPTKDRIAAPSGFTFGGQRNMPVKRAPGLTWGQQKQQRFYNPKPQRDSSEAAMVSKAQRFDVDRGLGKVGAQGSIDDILATAKTLKAAAPPERKLTVREMRAKQGGPPAQKRRYTPDQAAKLYAQFESMPAAFRDLPEFSKQVDVPVSTLRQLFKKYGFIQ